MGQLGNAERVVFLSFQGHQLSLQVERSPLGALSGLNL